MADVMTSLMSHLRMALSISGAMVQRLEVVARGEVVEGSERSLSEGATAVVVSVAGFGGAEKAVGVE